MLSDLRDCPLPLVIESLDVTFMLHLAFCRPWVDAPCVGGVAFLKYPFGGEGGENFFALGPGGKRPHGGSLPFERGCCRADIFTELL